MWWPGPDHRHVLNCDLLPLGASLPSMPVSPPASQDTETRVTGRNDTWPGLRDGLPFSHVHYLRANGLALLAKAR